VVYITTGLFTLQKEPRYSSNRRLGGPNSRYGRYEEDTSLFLLPEFETRTVQPVASRSTHYVPRSQVIHAGLFSELFTNYYIYFRSLQSKILLVSILQLIRIHHITRFYSYTPLCIVHCCTLAPKLGARSAPVLISGSPCLLDSLLSIRLYKLFLICLHISVFVEKIFIRITRGEFAPEFSSSFLYDVIC
jgi:hypothetical protein